MISIDSESSLLCPLCKGNLLHHKRVEVFERNAEESKSGSHVVVDLFTDYKPEISVTPSMRGNPSGRRGAILINFWCETCRQTSVLKISQHKGQTFIQLCLQCL